jgi:hypothetical protein
VGADLSSLDIGTPQPVTMLGDWETDMTHVRLPGSRRMLVVFFMSEDDQPGGPGVTLLGMTYGGKPMTRVPTVGRSVHDTGSTQNIVELWYLLEADLALAVNDNIGATLSRNPTETPMYAHVLLQSVDQSSPFGDGDIYACTCNPISTDPLSTRLGDLVLTVADNRELGAHTPLNGFTLGVGQSLSSHTGTTAYKPATGADETPSFSHDTSPYWHAILGVVVQAASEP